jgi:hypothetical protein
MERKQPDLAGSSGPHATVSELGEFEPGPGSPHGVPGQQVSVQANDNKGSTDE